jgi:hypothetical protein
MADSIKFYLNFSPYQSREHQGQCFYRMMQIFLGKEFKYDKEITEDHVESFTKKVDTHILKHFQQIHEGEAETTKPSQSMIKLTQNHFQLPFFMALRDFVSQRHHQQLKINNLIQFVKRRIEEIEEELGIDGIPEDQEINAVDKRKFESI